MFSYFTLAAFVSQTVGYFVSVSAFVSFDPMPCNCATGARILVVIDALLNEFLVVYGSCKSPHAICRVLGVIAKCDRGGFVSGRFFA